MIFLNKVEGKEVEGIGFKVHIVQPDTIYFITKRKKKKHPEENGGHTIRVSLTDEAEVSKGKAVAVRYYILHQMLPKSKVP